VQFNDSNFKFLLESAPFHWPLRYDDKDESSFEPLFLVFWLKKCVDGTKDEMRSKFCE
jgi:hypothetical protein